ncbi:MAG: thiamine phosphate synthase [Agathobacter sp.]|nr:thiamine phosphate synthase [Agathobacter sp.]
MKKEQLKLYAITHDEWHQEMSLMEQVEEALKGGATMIQYRDKNLTEQEMEETARELLQLCRRYQIPFLINDHVELAKRIDADGVHIGQCDMSPRLAREILGPDKIIGVTAKTTDQAMLAWKQGADYLGSGAVFGTSTKKDAKPMSRSLLQEICKSVPIPVVAIGGIEKDNVSTLKGTDIAGVAVVSGIFAQEDIEAGTRELFELVESILN